MLAPNDLRTTQSVQSTSSTDTQGGMDIEALGRALANTPGSDAWQVDVIAEEEAQLYLIGDRTEARRLVTNEQAVAHIHNLHAPHGGADMPGGQALGEAETPLLASDTADPARLAARFADGVTMASLTDNPPFTLPAAPAQGYPSPDISDPALLGGQAAMMAALDGLRARLEAAVATQSGVRLSSAEFYATRSHRMLRNSRGLTAASAGTQVFFDLVLIAQSGDREAEVHAEMKRRRLADLQIEGTVAAYSAFARHSLRAVTPATARGPVILSGEAVANLFYSILFFNNNPLLTHSSAAAAYQKISRFKPGELITPEEPRGDRLTLASDGLRPFGVRSAPFDDEGLPASNLPIIENGVLRRYWADMRYATYLNVEPTGNFGNVTVARGSAPLAALRQTGSAPVYEVVLFSAFNPDPVTGDFAGEIRLGYRHNPDGTVTPIKGGALTGNVFAALADARFSSDAYTDGVYYGPAAIRFGDLTIAGE
ncbi:MAG: TldD/PmbA family protein [Ktedonobacterales bacterium]